MDWSEIKIQTAIIAGSVTAIGWLVTHVLAVWREDLKHSREAYLLHTEKQLEELYGPLAFQVYEGRRTFKDLLSTLGRSAVFLSSGESLSEDDLKTWQFWAENDFRPRNKTIKQLLLNKPHLIEGNSMPKSYVEFLDHCNSWEINHLRWELEGVEYSWHSNINWPDKFEEDVINVFSQLQKRRASLIIGMSTARVSLPWVIVIMLIGGAIWYFAR